jgi:hypothetical protein
VDGAGLLDRRIHRRVRCGPGAGHRVPPSGDRRPAAAGP